MAVATTGRFPFELDPHPERALITPHAGVPVVLETWRASDAGAVLDQLLPKKRKGLPASHLVESALALILAGGDTVEDLEVLRRDAALSVMLGYSLPAAQTFRDFLETFHEPHVPLLWQGPKVAIPGEGERLEALRQANARLITFAREHFAPTTATIDADTTILESHKRAAQPTYKGGKGYQPVVALWHELGLVVADEFRDGNVPAAACNLHVLRQALAQVRGVEQVYLRADSALYDHEVLALLEGERVRYAISADMGAALAAAVAALPDDAWRLERDEGDALRFWAEVAYVPDDGVYRKDRPDPPRYLAVRILKKQGLLFADGSDRKHFCIVTNRPDDGLAILQWHRGKAGTIEPTHDILTNELAAEALPSQKFGANAAWFRLNVLAFNLLRVFQRGGLPSDLHRARPKRLRFLRINSVGRLVRHGGQRLVRMAAQVLGLADRARSWPWCRPPPCRAAA